jgi:hypothetical protein
VSFLRGEGRWSERIDARATLPEPGAAAGRIGDARSAGRRRGDLKNIQIREAANALDGAGYTRCCR